MSRLWDRGEPLQKRTPDVFDAARCRAALGPGMYAVHEAYRKVRDEGLPFREAYRRVKRDL